jgi:hypothetical protein
MQNVVRWWCELLGVTDPAAVQVAVGVVSAGALIAATLIVLGLVFAGLRKLDRA